MKISMPENARYIIDTLIKNGYEAYIVGGCVRDSVLGKKPSDWDITTSATPEETKSLFKRTIDTGIEHGTVTIMMDKEGYEVTTYRIDGKYEDHRRPKDVEFTKSLEEDLKRRDFTINAMAYNDVEGVIDKFGGISDLDNHIIKCVGNAEERFDEDALRILRAIRFSAQLNFTIEENTRKAISKKAIYLKDISAERIQVELTKLLVSDYPEKLIEGYNLGVTKIVLPEFDKMMETPQNNPYHIYNVGEHTIAVIKSIEPTPILRWAALLHDVAKPCTKVVGEDGIDHFYEHQQKGSYMAEDILKRMKMDNHTISRVKRIIKWHDFGIFEVPKIRSFRKSLSKMGADLFEDYVKIKRADIAGQSDYKREEKINILEVMETMYFKIISEQQCLSVKDLDIDGKQLIELGISPGPNMKIILNILLESVLENPEYNTFSWLSNKAVEINSTL